MISREKCRYINKITKNTDQYNDWESEKTETIVKYENVRDFTLYLKNDNDLFSYNNNQTEFSFGQYLGKTIDYILSNDPEYIIWCIINLDTFLVSLKVMLSAQLENSTNYIKALRINTVKFKMNRDILEDKQNSGSFYDDYDPYDGDGWAWFHDNQ